MGLIFPKAMITEVRAAFEARRAPKHPGTTFPGTYTAAPEAVVCHGTYRAVSGVTFPIWCACCAEEIEPGQYAIMFMYDLYPQDGRSCPTDHWLHAETCEHSGMGVPKH